MALIKHLHLEGDRRNCVLLILLDLSEAFDHTIDQEVLMECLPDLMGVPRITLYWFCSFLAMRSQVLVMAESSSSSLDLSFGVPQDFILLLLLFTAYMRPLDKTVCQSE